MSVEISVKVQAKVDAARAEIEVLKQRIQEVAATEALVVGQQYSIQVGKGETARIIEATLIGERKKDTGASEYRFSAGEGFDARFYDLSINKVVRDVPEGTVSSATLSKQVSRLETSIENLLSGKVKLKGQIDLVNGESYTIKTGKPGSGETTTAVLMDQRFNDVGNQEFAFFYGAGFDAKVVVCGSSRVVLAEEAGDLGPDVAEEAAE